MHKGMDVLYNATGQRLDRRFNDGAKSFTCSVQVSPNARLSMLEKFIYAEISKNFKRVHKQGFVPCNTKVEFVLHTSDTVFDMGSYGAQRLLFRKLIEKAGMGHPQINISHKKDSMYFVEISVSFKDIHPLELFRTE